MRIFELNCNIRDNDELRGSFNALTHEVFCFGFEDWYKSGGWGDMYIPHAVVENGEVIANVSVNIMPFSVGGEMKNYGSTAQLTANAFSVRLLAYFPSYRTKST